MRVDMAHRETPDLARWPQRLTAETFYPIAYPLMLLSRRLEERILELFQKGYVKGTVTISIGNEATTIGMSMPLRPGRDFVSLLHRDFGAHLLTGSSPHVLLCQYLANAGSPTHGFEGNVHHGDAANRRFPMISHLGKMLSVVVGGTWAARRQGEHVFGLAVIGDGGSSTGEFHESLNIASVREVPVLFLIENNHYAFSTPTRMQYHCGQLSDRAAGYGMRGRTIDGTDPWNVYSAVCDAFDAMSDRPGPMLLECTTLRLGGHAAYDKGLYVPGELMEQWRREDPLLRARQKLEEVAGFSPLEITAMEEAVESEVRDAVTSALAVARPAPPAGVWPVYATGECTASVKAASESVLQQETLTPYPPADGRGELLQILPMTRPAARVAAPCVKPLHAKSVKNGEAVNLALDYLLANHPTSYLAGMDVGAYGSAFKTCKGLIDRYGPERVIDMPLAESAIMGFALGSSQAGAGPIVEFQFADFSTEAVSQLGLNAGTWHFRTGCPAPLLVRLPCGGGLTMGAFHSGEFEGLWSRFPGLKLLYPATPQETYEALLAGFYDPNPCLVFEHKLLYWSKGAEIDFNGDLAAVWRPRRYVEGSDLTIVAFGAMVPQALTAVQRTGRSIEVWNPFVLQPLDIGPIVASVAKTGRLLVVQESGMTQGLGDRIVSLVMQQAMGTMKCPPQVIATPDTPIPFAPELESACRPSLERICAAIESMLMSEQLAKQSA